MKELGHLGNSPQYQRYGYNSQVSYTNNEPTAAKSKSVVQKKSKASGQQSTEQNQQGDPLSRFFAMKAGTIPAPTPTGMPEELKRKLEGLSGFYMGDVKVHYNSDKPAQLQAHAYTQGTDIYLGPGQEKYLPHEAWHVVQQKQGRVQPTELSGGLAVNADSGLEKEAEDMGERIFRTPEVCSTHSLLKSKPVTSSNAVIQLKNSKEKETKKREKSKKEKKNVGSNRNFSSPKNKVLSTQKNKKVAPEKKEVGKGNQNKISPSKGLKKNIPSKKETGKGTGSKSKLISSPTKVHPIQEPVEDKVDYKEYEGYKGYKGVLPFNPYIGQRKKVNPSQEPVEDKVDYKEYEGYKGVLPFNTYIGQRKKVNPSQEPVEDKVDYKEYEGYKGVLLFNTYIGQRKKVNPSQELSEKNTKLALPNERLRLISIAEQLEENQIMHKNALAKIDAFANEEMSAMPFFDFLDGKEGFINDLKAIISNPTSINQARSELCGIAEDCKVIIEQNPEEFVEMVISLYKSGGYRNLNQPLSADNKIKESCEKNVFQIGNDALSIAILVLRKLVSTLNLRGVHDVYEPIVFEEDNDPFNMSGILIKEDIIQNNEKKYKVSKAEKDVGSWWFEDLEVLKLFSIEGIYLDKDNCDIDHLVDNINKKIAEGNNISASVDLKIFLGDQTDNHTIGITGIKKIDNETIRISWWSWGQNRTKEMPKEQFKNSLIHSPTSFKFKKQMPEQHNIGDDRLELEPGNVDKEVDNERWLDELND